MWFKLDNKGKPRNTTKIVTKKILTEDRAEPAFTILSSDYSNSSLVNTLKRFGNTQLYFFTSQINIQHKIISKNMRCSCARQAINIFMDLERVYKKNC